MNSHLLYGKTISMLEGMGSCHAVFAVRGLTHTGAFVGACEFWQVSRQRWNAALQYQAISAGAGGIMARLGFLRHH